MTIRNEIAKISHTLLSEGIYLCICVLYQREREEGGSERERERVRVSQFHGESPVRIRPGFLHLRREITLPSPMKTNDVHNVGWSCLVPFPGIIGTRMHARELQRDYWKPIAGNILPEVAHILRQSPTQRERDDWCSTAEKSLLYLSRSKERKRKKNVRKKGQNNSPIFIKAKGRGKITITRTVKRVHKHHCLHTPAENEA